MGLWFGALYGLPKPGAGHRDHIPGEPADASRLHAASRGRNLCGLGGLGPHEPRGGCVKYARWTNVEVRRLKEMHVGRRPSKAEVSEAFPRHPIWSVMNMARQLGLRCGRRHPLERDVTRWLRVAHKHFARRETGLLA